MKNMIKSDPRNQNWTIKSRFYTWKLMILSGDWFISSGLWVTSVFTWNGQNEPETLTDVVKYGICYQDMCSKKFFFSSFATVVYLKYGRIAWEFFAEHLINQINSTWTFNHWMILSNEVSLSVSWFLLSKRLECSKFKWTTNWMCSK